MSGQKIWGFTELSDDTLTNVVNLLKQYSYGLNNQQTSVKATIDMMISVGGNPMILFKVNGGLLFSVTIKHNNTMILNLIYNNKNENYDLDYDKLEPFLDRLITDKTICSYITHLIRCEEITQVRGNIESHTFSLDNMLYAFRMGRKKEVIGDGVKNITVNSTEEDFKEHLKIKFAH